MYYRSTVYTMNKFELLDKKTFGITSATGVRCVRNVVKNSLFKNKSWTFTKKKIKQIAERYKDVDPLVLDNVREFLFPKMITKKRRKYIKFNI